MSNIQVKAFLGHKEELSFAECADRFSINAELGHFAITDGVSGSYFPQVWSDILCNSYAKLDISAEENWFDKYFSNQFINDSKLWETRTKQIEEEADDDLAFLLLLQKEEYKYGASTLAGIRFYEQNLHIDVVGDSCVFLIETINGISIRDYSTIDKEKGFNNFPDYIMPFVDIRPKSYSIMVPLFQGYIMMMTDALSEWFTNHSQKEIIENLWSLNSHSDFNTFIHQMTESSDSPLKDDDYALLMLKIDHPDFEGFNILHEDNLNELIKNNEK